MPTFFKITHTFNYSDYYASIMLTFYLVTLKASSTGAFYLQ